MIRAFFTIEAVFVLFLLPFLLYFAISVPSVSAKTKLAEKEKMELAQDILASWDGQGRLDYADTDGLISDTQRLGKESSYCLTLRGTARKMTEGCVENVCAFRTVVSDNAGKISFERLFLCVE